VTCDTPCPLTTIKPTPLIQSETRLDKYLLRWFFRQMIKIVPCEADRTLYVGDRMDNDILPAARLGLKTALIRRGPWAVIQQDDPNAYRVPTMRIGSLAELPGKIAAFNAGVC
jgi:ribonucleotide monophosphatase NagD (HAD superfamily)